jgi:hypothetical protein
MSFSDRDSDSDAVMIDHDDISNYNPDNILPQPPETIAKIRDWLQPTSYDVVGSEYRKHLNAHLDGTGAWLTASTTYQEWLQNSKHGLLWIKGIPGSGKSVLAASLIYELSKSRPGVPVLFFFFRQIIAANHEPQALLRDWMHQLLDYSPPLQSQLKEHMDEDHSVESLPVKDMWNTLRMAFHNLPGEVFCVADALDEMDGGNEPFLDALGAVGSWNPAKVKILITSRPVPSVEEPLRRASGVHLRLQERLVDADISMFVRAALSSSEIPQDRWDVITDAVPGQANGLFLYARLAMDAFLEPGADIDSVLSKLPTDLNVMYTELLREHAQRSKVSTEIQDLILQAVTHTTRPLRLIELAEMIRHINPDASTRDMKATKDVVRTACGPLLEILADETVSVVHHSFTEYLRGTTRQSNSTGYPILESGSTNARLALACLQYMQAGCLSEVQIRSDDETKMKDSKRSKCLNRGFPARQVTPEDAQFKLRHAFFDYAADNWHRHIVRAENAGYDQTHMISELGNFLNNDQNLRAWLQKKWPGTFMSLGCVTKVHVAAKTGLVSYIKALIDKTKMDNPDACGKTPMYVTP